MEMLLINNQKGPVQYGCTTFKNYSQKFIYLKTFLNHYYYMNIIKKVLYINYIADYTA